MTLRQKTAFCSVRAVKKKIQSDSQFLALWLTPSEKRYCLARRHSAEPVAARIAAKRALLALLGVTAVQHTLWSRDIRVQKKATGLPYFLFSARLKKKFKFKTGERWLLTLAHERKLAAAWVVGAAPYA